MRKETQATNLRAAECDSGSAQIILIVGLLSIILLLSASVLNNRQIAYLNSPYIAWLRIEMMVGRFALRYEAAKTLGTFYTRTLQIVEKHES